MNFFWDIYDSKFGPILLISNQNGLVRVSLPSQNPTDILDRFMIHTDGILTHRMHSIIETTKKQLDQYFNNQRKTFFVPLDMQGTEFQKKVWRALRLIEFGQTKSYQDIARTIDQPNACRAIGMANHHNPIPIIVPCHRVIAKDGSLGGFANNTDACLALKQQLLQLEQHTLQLDYTGCENPVAPSLLANSPFKQS